MKQRISIKDLEPGFYQAMFGLGKYEASTSITAGLKDLIKIRASQINGCAYCLQIHTVDARKGGESEYRIYALSAWWESPLFSDAEKAALAVTDEVTLIADRGLSEATYQEASRHFNDHEMAQLIAHIIAINAWNRIAVSTHMFHEVS
ncbi:MAG: carboxymuconolactone decarboxylase family protein [Imperialibacter sp.]|uniref:carboxymuconolactone decarboxylase family protein n=1 Tax=Imperialibacter sp. TaxID=2038411 RepID=UPI003A887B28